MLVINPHTNKEVRRLKNIRVAVGCLCVVVMASIFFYLDNRELNALKSDQAYPMIEEPTQHPQSLTEASHKIADTPIYLTKIYSLNDSKGLYFGMWYRNGNNMMDNAEKNWQKESGEIDFLVKAVDSNGTTYDGRTNGTVDGTFSTLRFIQFDDFHYDGELEKIELAFYPIISADGKGIPYEKPWLEATLQVE